MQSFSMPSESDSIQVYRIIEFHGLWNIVSSLSDVFDIQLKILNVYDMYGKLKTTIYSFIRLHDVFDTQLVQDVYDSLKYGKTKTAI